MKVPDPVLDQVDETANVPAPLVIEPELTIPPVDVTAPVEILSVPAFVEFPITVILLAPMASVVPVAMVSTPCAVVLADKEAVPPFLRSRLGKTVLMIVCAPEPAYLTVEVETESENGFALKFVDEPRITNFASAALRVMSPEISKAPVLVTVPALEITRVPDALVTPMTVRFAVGLLTINAELVVSKKLPKTVEDAVKLLKLEVEIVLTVKLL